MTIEDIHPYEPFVPENAAKIIIGTIPPSRFCKNNAGEMNGGLMGDDVQFYYGSRDNYFWKIIGEVCVYDFKYSNTNEAIKQRKAFLEEHGIGITDIVEQCGRINGSSSDKKLRVTKYKDIEKLLRNNPQIDTLIYTSKYVCSLINNALTTGDYKTEHSNWIPPKKREGELRIRGISEKPYRVIVLYSPSPQTLRGLGPDGKKMRKDQYRDVFT